MYSPPSLLLVLLAPAAVTLYFLWTFLMLVLRQARSPLRHLPGPPSPSFFMGNLREMHDQENNGLVARWAAAYGSTFVYRGFIGGCRLMTVDPLAVNHIMSRGYEYPKPDFVRDALASMAAGYEGLLTAEGDMHRKQRKILNPAFSAAQIRSLTPIFWETAIRLRDIWLDITASPKAFFTPVDPFARAEAPPSPGTADPEPAANAPLLSPSAVTTSFLPNPFAAFVPSKASPTIPTVRARQPAGSSALELASDAPCRLDVLPWLARAALDVIGEAGFGYAFHSLEAAAERRDYESELAQAFGVIFGTARKFRVMTILQVWFPVLRRFKRENAAMQHAQATMRKIGTELIEQRRAAVAAESEKTSEKRSAIEGDKTVFDRDLLSVLVRSNISEVPEQRMSMNELLCQISTFLAAGHETSASALTWTLYALARCPSAQAKLRAELRSVPVPSAPSAPVSSPPPSQPSFSQQPSTPASVPSSPERSPPSSPTSAAAAYDAAMAALFDRISHLPYLDAVVREALRLYAPITTTMRVATQDDVIPVAAPYMDRRGRMCDEIRVRKGDIISVPIQAMNKGRETWGEDADVFRPERWEEGRHREERCEEKGRGKHVQGLWGNMLTFGGGNPVNGNRSCIGYRFALSEIKVFLFVLLRDIEFSNDSAVEIEKKVNVVTRPCVKSEPHRGNQMPLYIRRVLRSPSSDPRTDRHFGVS
ncbi:cytochrome P450 [Dichomitus squalens LYAD-421 SS1]|uniref:Cytochrome P450 n=1 Tax=Dichomitus squalens (strain LYAD-421) TaxID=732165 RepID=R7SPS4_DICSQ|nr:cytochrome P450 [Dichomitus squalens LYAD-421 SS1]EJF57948.1 cytochrome P450 [Dichomitus squalens LYAD-421 SS1]